MKIWVKGISGKEEGEDEDIILLLHPLGNIEITNFFNYEPKRGTFAIYLNDKNSKGTH